MKTELRRKDGEPQAGPENVKLGRAQLLQLEKLAAIGQLAAGVAHELNNPIGYISSNLATLKRYLERLTTVLQAHERVAAGEEAGAESPQELRMRLKLDAILEDLPVLLSECAEGVERIRGIVTDLRGFSRPDDNTPVVCDINKVLQSTLNIVNKELSYKADVITDFGPLPPLRCLPGQLSQVFLNLLLNAAQAIEDHGEIRVTSRRDGESIVVEVADTGSGMTAEQLARVFEPFYSTKEAGKGTGLGLSISLDIVRKHGGDILVESEPGRGTRFRILFPVTADGDHEQP